MEEKDERFTYVYISALLCNQALTEYFFVSPHNKTNEELELINGPPFSFYKVTLQYCFNSEYNKLLEPDEARDKSKPNKHIASLFKLNNNLYASDEAGFKSVYLTNVDLLSSLANTVFHDTHRQLRNIKFSHSDQSPINNPLQLQGLSEDDINEGFRQLRIIYEIINNCAGYFGFNYTSHVPHYEDRTKNFIKFHALYKKYFYANYMRALNEGYILF